MERGQRVYSSQAQGNGTRYRLSKNWRFISTNPLFPARKAATDGRLLNGGTSLGGWTCDGRLLSFGVSSEDWTGNRGRLLSLGAPLEDRLGDPMRLAFLMSCLTMAIWHSVRTRVIDSRLT